MISMTDAFQRALLTVRESAEFLGYISDEKDDMEVYEEKGFVIIVVDLLEGVVYTSHRHDLGDKLYEDLRQTYAKEIVGFQEV